MWRRLVSLRLRTRVIAFSAPRSTMISASGVIAAGSLASRPRSYHHSSHSFSSDANKTAVKKFENVIATGQEREELEAELEGRNILEIDYPVGPFGTKEAPVVVKSIFDKRIVECPGGEGEDEHDVVWFWLKKGEPHECPVCSQYFVGYYVNSCELIVVIDNLEVVGPGGSPYRHGEEEDHH